MKPEVHDMMKELENAKKEVDRLRKNQTDEDPFRDFAFDKLERTLIRGVKFLSRLDNLGKELRRAGKSGQRPQARERGRGGRTRRPED